MAIRFGFGRVEQWLYGKKDIRVLDIGCGNHSVKDFREWLPDAEYHGIDRTKDYNNDETDFGLMDAFYEMDLTNLDFSGIPNSYFDLLYCSHNVEHLFNGDEVIKGLLKKLRLGGLFYLEWPSVRHIELPKNEDIHNYYQDASHVRLYPMHELLNVFTVDGMSILDYGTVPGKWISDWIIGRNTPALLLSADLSDADAWRYTDMLIGIQNEKVLLFGAGGSLHIWLKLYGANLDIIGVFDNDVAKQGQTICGYQVYSPDDLPTMMAEGTRLVVVSIYFKEIMVQLSQMGIDKYYVFIDGLKYTSAPHSESYGRVHPNANYTPWKSDSMFSKMYNAVIKNTLVDMFRAYELWQLVEEASKLSSGAIIEVGVWRGGTGVLIAKKAILCGIKETVYLCDTFHGIVKESDKDLYHRNGDLAVSSEAVMDLAKKLDVDNVKILQGIFPDDTAAQIKEESVRLVHVDVDVYDSASDIVKWVWDKIPIGGIIVFDDYGFESTIGVTTFVNEQRAEKDRIIIHNLNGHAIMIKIAGTC